MNYDSDVLAYCKRAAVNKQQSLLLPKDNIQETTLDVGQQRNYGSSEVSMMMRIRDVYENTYVNDQQTILEEEAGLSRTKHNLYNAIIGLGTDVYEWR